MNIDTISSTARILVFTFLALTFGCGGGGGGSDSGGGAAGAGSGQRLAPQSAGGNSIQLLDANQPNSTIEFAASGNTFSQFRTGTRDVIKSGNYSYTSTDKNATLTLVDAANNEVATLNLNFDSSSSGAFTSSTSKGAISSGTFSNFTPTPTLPPPSDGGGSGTGGGSGSGGGGGNPPPPGAGGLEGKVITLTRSTGQTHTYTFAGNQFTDSDPPEEGTGSYTYTRNGSQATLLLTYTGGSGPVNLAGDRHEIQLNFTEEGRGTYTSTYTTNENTTLSQDGVFEFLK